MGSVPSNNLLIMLVSFIFVLFHDSCITNTVCNCLYGTGDRPDTGCDLSSPGYRSGRGDERQRRIIPVSPKRHLG